MGKQTETPHYNTETNDSKMDSPWNKMRSGVQEYTNKKIQTIIRRRTKPRDHGIKSGSSEWSSRTHFNTHLCVG